MSTQDSTLQAMLAQYEAAAAASNFSNENTFDLKNYFSTFLPDGVNDAMKVIRILPTEESPFKVVYTHSANVEGQNRKFTCLQEMKNSPCPFCEARERLLSTGEEDDKKLAQTYRARKMYVIKIIDREKESEGPKFWRFPDAYKKDGVYDKIFAQIRMLNENVTHEETGRDFVLNIVRVKNPRGGTYFTVNSVIAKNNSPLSVDADLSKSWVEDEKTWEDVYSVKDYDYLKIIVMGEVPAWSKKLEKFVAKSSLEGLSEEEENTTDDLDTQVAFGSNSGNKVNSEDLVAEVVEDSYVPDEDDEDDDDLPF